MQPFRTLRIDRRKAAVNRFIALLARHAFVLSPHREIGLVAGKRAAFDERIHVQTRSANHHRYHAARQNILRRRVREFHIFRNRERLAGLADVNQMMADTLLLLKSRLRRADVHFLIQLHGIRRNDFCMQPFCQRNRKRGFPARRRAADTDQSIFHVFKLLWHY